MAATTISNEVFFDRRGGYELFPGECDIAGEKQGRPSKKRGREYEEVENQEKKNELVATVML